MGFFDFLKPKKKPKLKIQMAASEPTQARKSTPKRKETYADKTLRELKQDLEKQDRQLATIIKADEKYHKTNDIDEYIKFWEKIWNNGGLLFNGSKWTFTLPDLYIKAKRYDDALKILNKIRNPAYTEKMEVYIKRVKKLKAKANK